MMESLLPTLGLAVAAALLYGLLCRQSPAFAMLLSLAAGVVILGRLVFFLQGMIAGLTALAGRVDGIAFSSLLRCAGVLLLTDYACTICKEAEAEVLAWCTAFAGRVLTLAALWPLLEEVCGMIWELTG
ncbi:stage III sporulation protein AD [Faecalibacterium sp. An122]|uniref:stage III sporulation protein AD n=1 Tax=Faecalibacterium sp. An122 TaxID=1965551 RepID=UPI001FA8DF44|nr:stage III sporulation protein AD [Faecalibacterium sp. An122]